MTEITEEILKVVKELIVKAVSDFDSTDHIKRIISLHDQSKPKPEPVAYRWWNQGCNCDECDQYFYSEDPDFISKNREPLYAALPTREPLSEEFLMALAEECTAQFFNGVHQNATIHFARAVEKAHGIGGNDETTFNHSSFLSQRTY